MSRPTLHPTLPMFSVADMARLREKSKQEKGAAERRAAEEEKERRQKEQAETPDTPVIVSNDVSTRVDAPSGALDSSLIQSAMAPPNGVILSDTHAIMSDFISVTQETSTTDTSMTAMASVTSFGSQPPPSLGRASSITSAIQTQTQTQQHEGEEKKEQHHKERVDTDTNNLDEQASHMVDCPPIDSQCRTQPTPGALPNTSISSTANESTDTDTPLTNETHDISTVDETKPAVVDVAMVDVSVPVGGESAGAASTEMAAIPMDIDNSEPNKSSPPRAKPSKYHRKSPSPPPVTRSAARPFDRLRRLAREEYATGCIMTSGIRPDTRKLRQSSRIHQCKCGMIERRLVK